MSLNAKNKLFGVQPNPEEETSKVSASVPAPKPISKTSGMDLSAIMGGTSIGLSEDVKQKHVTDALIAIKSAEKSLETGIFQWSPDYTCAAPMYERASTCYHSADDYSNEVKYMLKCAECHKQSGAYSGAAFALQKTGIIAQKQQKHAEAMEYFVYSAEQWGLAGELNKYADFYMKAGCEGALTQHVDSTTIIQYFNKALKIALPPDRQTVDQLKSIHPQVFDMSRKIFAYYVSQDSLIREAIALGMSMGWCVGCIVYVVIDV